MTWRAVRPDRSCVWAQYTVFIDERAAIQERLKAQGIPTAVHYPRPIHHQPVFERFASPDDCPESIRAAAQVFSLPMSADLTDGDQLRVAAAVKRSLLGSAI